MERFLSQCAKYIFEKHSKELHRICLIFPNRRSGVFFRSYLQTCIKGAVIGPKITTVGEFISECSDLQSSEKLQLISILYDIFKKHTNTTETFDDFYFWGEILLSDFNDIDRYLVNSKDIFRNIADIKEIDSLFDYLTSEQKKALEQFWGSVAVGKKEFQKRYIHIWDKLLPIYAEFKKVLLDKNMAYGGMINRSVVEKIKMEGLVLSFKKYFIIGLNALNTSEKKLFSYLRNEGKAEFLWDYDVSYTEDLNNEAGFFMRENLKRFPPPDDFYLKTNITQVPRVKLVAVSSLFGQSQEIPVFLDEIKEKFNSSYDNTAIVLADESLLYSALGAIPENIETVNVTMGYPVKNSVVYGFLLLLVNLLKNKKIDSNRDVVVYHRFATNVLNHQLLGEIENEKVSEYILEVKTKNKITLALKEINFSEIHERIFTLPENVEEYSDYFLLVLDGFYKLLKEEEHTNKMLLELIYTIYQAIEKLKTVVSDATEKQLREISPAIYFRLFSQYLGQVSVAFEGEPLSGMQVMGILETRCLDFENLVILGLNENKWPRTFTAPSFIPHNIRKGFGLPGIDEQDAMYAYYFYRLIQRAKNVTATYSVVKEGISTGELSRYAYQLMYDSHVRPEKTNLGFTFANDPEVPIKIQSSQSKVAGLLTRLTENHPLSPSAIISYLQCSLRFYFRYIMQLPESDEVKDEIDSPVFGNIFHETVEALYQPFVGTTVTKSNIEELHKNNLLIENEIIKAISKHYFKQKDTGVPVKLEGKTRLIFENTRIFVKQLLQIDMEIAPFALQSLEQQYKMQLPVSLNGKLKNIWIGGKIDRIDRAKGKLRVLDYKTGDVDAFSFKEIDELFQHDVKKLKKEILQALIYSCFLQDNMPEERDLQPVIYCLRKFFSDPYKPEIKWNNKDFSFTDIKSDFAQQLTSLVEEILSPKNTFSQTIHEEKCQYCAYNSICRRF